MKKLALLLLLAIGLISGASAQPTKVTENPVNYYYRILGLKENGWSKSEQVDFYLGKMKGLELWGIACGKEYIKNINAGLKQFGEDVNIGILSYDSVNIVRCVMDYSHDSLFSKVVNFVNSGDSLGHIIYFRDKGPFSGEISIFQFGRLPNKLGINSALVFLVSIDSI